MFDDRGAEETLILALVPLCSRSLQAWLGQRVRSVLDEVHVCLDAGTIDELHLSLRYMSWMCIVNRQQRGSHWTVICLRL